MASKPYTVFISATQRDQELAKDLSKRLQSVGVNVTYVEEDIRLGDSRSITKRIQDAMQASDEVFVLMTHNSAQDPWISFETGAALSLEKPVTPILVGVDEKSPTVTLSGHAPVKYSDLDKAIGEVQHRAHDAAESKRNPSRAYKADAGRPMSKGLKTAKR